LGTKYQGVLTFDYNNHFSKKLQIFFFNKRYPKMSQPKPSVTPKLEDPKFGFNQYSERLNGRAAMIGFLLMVVIEYVTNEGVLAWLGLQ
jgi:hypothetical protein